MIMSDDDDNDDDNNVFYANFCDFSPNEFNQNFHEKCRKSFTVSHVNIRSLNKNFEKLRLLYEECIEPKFDIIGISEVWNVSSIEGLCMEGYQLEISCRDPSVRGGGVGAYIHSSVSYKILQGNVIHAESIWIETCLNKRLTIIGIIYRKPNTDVTEFENSLIYTLEKLKLDKKDCILMGDFNIDIHNPCNAAGMFVSSLHCIGLRQLIKSCTRITSQSASLIDHIYSNVNITKIHAGTILTDVSDHLPTYAIFERRPSDTVHKIKHSTEVLSILTGAISVTV